MSKRPPKKFLSLLLLLTAGLTACDQGVSPDRLTGPSRDLGTNYQWNTVPMATDVEIHGKTLIGVVGKAGGMLRNGDHWLSIPADAVSEDTEFTFKIVGGKHVKVDFSARRVATGLPVKTFSKALTLGLSYKEGKVTDPTKLFIAYVLEGTLLGARERLVSTVYPEIFTVTAPIWHFSEYEIGVD